MGLQAVWDGRWYQGRVSHAHCYSSFWRTRLPGLGLILQGILESYTALWERSKRSADTLAVLGSPCKVTHGYLPQNLRWSSLAQLFGSDLRESYRLPRIPENACYCYSTLTQRPKESGSRTGLPFTDLGMSLGRWGVPDLKWHQEGIWGGQLLRPYPHAGIVLFGCARRWVNVENPDCRETDGCRAEIASCSKQLFPVPKPLSLSSLPPCSQKRPTEARDKGADCCSAFHTAGAVKRLSISAAS